ncbi:transporter family-2 protein [Rarobacter incanus]|uniref:Transporter family-2 protein n=1 Tax=Rarobacter incanus TaxID=153494 RepID=A0A542SPE2_9MICO|nr:transporter family-2 protein [Rarobacter incanus]
MPVQTAINTRLSRALASTWLASASSFLVGTTALAAVFIATRPDLSGFDAGAQPWWIWIGGACGVVFLTLNMVLMGHMGAATAVVIPVVGQVVGGLIIDEFSLVGAPAHPISAARIVGASLVIVGAWLSSVNRSARPLAAPIEETSPAAQRTGGNATRTAAGPAAQRTANASIRRGRFLPALVAVGVVGGMLSAVQTTANGALGARAGSAIFAALVSFAVGAVCLVAITLGARTWRSIPWETDRPAPKLFVGGLLGAAFVAGSAYAAPTLGTSVTVSVVLLGQLIASLVIDHFGALGAAKRPVTSLRLLGAATVLAGVAVVRLIG